jgi:hypothetical protein
VHHALDARAGRSLFEPAPRSTPMMDVVYLSLTAALLAATWGLVRLCDRV